MVPGRTGVAGTCAVPITERLAPVSQLLSCHRTIGVPVEPLDQLCEGLQEFLSRDHGVAVVI